MKTKSIQVTISVLLLIGFFYFIDTSEMFSVISHSDKWNFYKESIVYTANYYKFTQNKELKKILFKMWDKKGKPSYTDLKFAFDYFALKLH